jgi:cell division protein FtsA
MEKQAEELKIQYGSAIAEKKQENTIISLEGLKGREEKEFSLFKLNSIIEARMEEILHAVMFQIESAGIKDKLSGGIVVTGGGSLLTNLKQLAAYITGNDIRIALPTEYIEGPYSDIINKPQFSTAVGLIMTGDAFNNLELEKSIYDNLNKSKAEEEAESQIESEHKEHKKDNQQNTKLLEKLKSRMAKLFDEDEN